MLEGDGVARMREAFDRSPDPLCVFHSACLFYWPTEAKQALEELFLAESRNRPFWRIGIEPSDTFDEWHKGRPGHGDNQRAANRKSGEIAVTRYEGGSAQRRVLGHPNADYGIIDWFG